MEIQNSERLLATLEEKSSSSQKLDIINILGNIDIADKEAHVDEKAFLTSLIRMLAHDMDVQIRSVLASSIKNNNALTPEIARKLASDVVEVSTPILEFSSQLDEHFLIDLVQQSDAEKQKAIARRTDTTERVSEALVEYAVDDSVITTLLNNHHARISGETYETITEKYQDNEEVIRSLIIRNAVPLYIIEQVRHAVGEHIRENVLKELADKYDATYSVLTMIADRTDVLLMLSILDTRDSPQDAADLAEQLYQQKDLDANVFISSLFIGKSDFAMHALSKLSGQPFQHIQTLFHQPLGMELETVIDQANLPASFAADLYQCVRFAEESGKMLSHAFVPLLYYHIQEHRELFPGANYFLTLLAGHPYFKKLAPKA